MKWLTLASVLLIGCGDNTHSSVSPGETGNTVFPDIFGDQLGDPLPTITLDQLQTFDLGKTLGLRRFTTADGLGPAFNVTFCFGCHEKPAFGGDAGRYRNFLIEGNPVGSDGPFEFTGNDGIQDQFAMGEVEREPTDPDTTVMATRNPIPFFGDGLLAEIPEAEILSRADPDDLNGDGIRGRPNWDQGYVGRFGRKAQISLLEEFVRGPMAHHLGITSNPMSYVRRTELPVPPPGYTSSGTTPDQVGVTDVPITDDDGVPDPELSDDDLFDLTAFVMLTAPARPAESTPESEEGNEMFDDAGCNGCHVPALIGPRGAIPAYTDLLLHDMGPDLDDGFTFGSASGADWKTAPLWDVSATGPYLHDGRADTLDEAIRDHGGEAQSARDSYVSMTDEQRSDIIAFLDSLGGYDQVTPGLLQPNDPVPAPNDNGGPVAGLDDTDRATFIRGRAVFDRDFLQDVGLGPLYNGDSCRGCHQDPVLGGAGPRGVNVIRQGYLDPTSGVFTPPAAGTIAHRFITTPGVRAPIDPNSNVFEARQPPTLFGVGLIDQIPDATILSHADPDDSNGDGISGRADILPDGRLGRFGWKADLPSTAEFVRDALNNEMGITAPAQAGLTFGETQDMDSIPDPEISLQDLQDLQFFVANVAPPPRTSTNPTLEAQGQQVFGTIGCANCHIPSMQTASGVDVPLYSDLLLHDVSMPWQVGVTSAQATIHEFRTPPLWGLANTAPYLHDGSAPTIAEAILAHGGEASAIRDAFEALSPSDQAALLAFLQSL